MMKKLLSTFLCILMIISMLAVPVSAFVDLDDPNVTWNDRSALKLESPLHANHPVYIPFGKNITQKIKIEFFTLSSRWICYNRRRIAKEEQHGKQQKETSGNDT